MILVLVCASQADPIGLWVSTHEDLGGVHAIAAIPTTDEVAVLNAESGTLRMGLSPESEILDLSRSLHQPLGLAIAATGRIYVADTGHHRVMYFTPEGAMIGGFGGAGDEPFQMQHPHAIDLSDALAVVADTGHNRIQLFQIGGQHIRNIEGDTIGLNRPEGVALDANGHIWIADTQNHRVLCVDQHGDIIHAIGSWGTFPGQFMEPSGIDAKDGRVVVTDRLNHRVQIFDMETAALLESWGMHAVYPRQGEGKVHYPADAALLSGGDVVIAEPFEERAQRFGTGGAEIEPPSLGPRGVQSHFGPVAATDGRFFCTWEPELRALHVFDLDRKTPLRLSTFGEPGEAAGQIGHLTAIDIDAANNRIWAVDAGNHRIHEWTISPPPPDKPRFDPGMATLRRSVPLPIAGPGELLHTNDKLIYLDQAGNTAWQIAGTSEHTEIELPLGRDPRAAVLCESTGNTQPPGAILDGIDKTIHLYGSWPPADNRASTISLAELIDPVDFAQTHDGSFVVVDRSGHRIHRFGIDGTHLNAWGERGSDHGQLWRPAAVVVDHHNRVIVLDHGNHRAQMFEPDGTWIMTFGAGRAWTRRPALQETD